MAATLSVNIYAINGSPCSTIQKYGFGTGSVVYRPYLGSAGTIAGVYGVIQTQDGSQWATAETVAQLTALAG
jgi:hypothetical protein